MTSALALPNKTGDYVTRAVAVITRRLRQLARPYALRVLLENTMNLKTGGTEHVDTNTFSDWMKLGKPRSSIVYAYGDLAAAVKRSESAELRAVAEMAWGASLAGLIYLTQRRAGVDTNGLGLFEYIATKSDPNLNVWRIRDAA